MSKLKSKQRIFEVITENQKILSEFLCENSIFYSDVRTLPNPTPKFDKTSIEIVDKDSFDTAYRV